MKCNWLLKEYTLYQRIIKSFFAYVDNQLTTIQGKNQSFWGFLIMQDLLSDNLELYDCKMMNIDFKTRTSHTVEPITQIQL